MWTRCEECRRLWREYAFATTDHVRLGNNLQLAALKGDTEAIAILTLQLKSAAEKRQSSREAIRGHETQHGNGSTSHSITPRKPVDQGHSPLERPVPIGLHKTLARIPAIK